jgi:hypothetical protein
VEGNGGKPAERKTGQKAFWLKILLTGAVMYVATLKVHQYTGNPYLVPTLVFVGNFLVPVSFVSFFYERRGIFSVGMTDTALCFLYGGIIGTVTAALVEPFFMTPGNIRSSFIAGFIEELAKITGVIITARRRSYNSYKDGIILGAAAGMGFAAFESTGYTFAAFINSGGSLSYTVRIMLVRGITAPVGHGIWTAIFSGVLLNESVAGRFNFNSRVVYAYLTSALLHGLWNGLPAILNEYVPSPDADILGLAAVGAVGILILYREWRKAEREKIPYA